MFCLYVFELFLPAIVVLLGSMSLELFPWHHYLIELGLLNQICISSKPLFSRMLPKSKWYLPAVTLWAEFQRQRFGDKGKESLLKKLHSFGVIAFHMYLLVKLSLPIKASL